ncbi:MAG: FAD-binding oxidoreductase [Candidatus Pacebacteria bacterium]|nr:FAD-binding oxidoreductase [Candidatus Paceibacterota bacterium]
MFKDEVQKIFAGEVLDDTETLSKYSHDASLLEVRPKLVVFPRNREDVKKLVSFVSHEKGKRPGLSLTGRSAGTDMTGGPLSESIVLDFTSHFKEKTIDAGALTGTVEPGVFFRDFEALTTPEKVSLPIYPASKQLAALGGMIMNNCAGEKTLRYGQMRDFVEEMNMVLSDGNEYTFRKLNREELQKKLLEANFEGEVYRKMHRLVTKNHDLIESAAPKTSKNSSGYALWRVWDKAKDTFDLSQIFVGSQGTLGLLTEAKVRLVKDTPERKLIALFFKNWDDLPAVVNAVLPFGVESMEAFDDTTLKLGIRFMPEIAKKVHQSLLRFASRFLPEVFIGIEMFGLPKLIVLIELAEEKEDVLYEKTLKIVRTLRKFPVHMRVLADGPDSEKYWIMRRESFNLLREHVAGKQTAPFIDDFIVPPEKMPEFLPKVLTILKENGIKANIAGHAGNGNYHIIPLMDLSKESERAKIIPVSEKVYELIVEYGGSITAEHNDGIVRTPFVEKMFGTPMYRLFKEVKHILDPQNIFNPGKKVGGTLAYFKAHIKGSGEVHK